jgi:hypothetical protein
MRYITERIRPFEEGANGVETCEQLVSFYSINIEHDKRLPHGAWIGR